MTREIASARRQATTHRVAGGAGNGGDARWSPCPRPDPAAPFETRKVTDNVYVFRYQFHRSIFVVTPDGVIATDPIGFLRPQAVTTYVAEIRKLTQAPIRYVVYSHHHYDHIDGG